MDPFPRNGWASSLGSGGSLRSDSVAHFVGIRIERGPQRLVGIVGAEEVCVAYEEALFVVVSIDEPAGNPLGPIAKDFAGVGMKHVHTVDLDLNLVI